MANGSFISNSGVSANLYVVWSSTTNATANTSSVTAVVYLRSYTMRFTALSNSYISINGNQLKFNGKVINKSSSSLTDTELARHTVTVAHNTDGTKSITITANLDFNGTVSGTSIDDFTASKTVTLDTIPRASGLSVASSINTGSTLTATITPANSAFTHKIEYFVDGVSKKISGSIAAGTTTLSQLIEHSWLSSVNSATMTVRLYTYSGSTHIGTTDKSVAVTVPPNLIPAVSKLEATIVNGLSTDGKVVSTGGYCVESKSQVKLVATATPGDGSALASYEFSGANISGNASTYTTTDATVTSSIIRSNGSITYGVIAKDNRPNRPSDEKTTSITVYPYSNPQIASITAQRCDSDGTLNNNGTYAKVTVTTSYSSVNGANKRVVTLYSSKDNYTTGTVILAATNSNNTYIGVYGSGFAIGSSYTIRAVITDSYNTGTTIQRSTILKVSERTMNIAQYGNGLAIGGLSSITNSTAEGLFECHWPLNISKDFTFTNTGEEQEIIFQGGGTTSSTVSFYKGASTSGTVLGLWDKTNDRPVWTYGTDGRLYSNRPTTISDSLNVTGNLATSGSITVTGGITSSGIVTGTSGFFTSTIDAGKDQHGNVALRLGNPTGNHIDIDDNELVGKYGKDGYAALYLVGSAVGIYAQEVSALVIGKDSTGGYIQSSPTYSRTTASSANVNINSSGTFIRSTASSARYKTEIADISSEELDPYKILNIPVRQFKYNEDNIPIDRKPDDLYIGLIAEEVNEVYPIATEYTEDGQIEMWNIKMLFPALLKIVQDQQKEIEALKEQINNKAVN